MRQRAATFFATCFYLGYVPLAPGTVGTLAAVCLYYLISEFSSIGYLVFILGFIVFSFLVSDEMSRGSENPDPQQIVIDEVCGYLTAMFLVKATFLNILLGFFLFRLFDIWKPPPVITVEKRLPGGAGIVADDVLAGIYANVVLQIITRLL